jgi:thiosulfate/3-mercaptopyruvate sulfurtransferase
MLFSVAVSLLLAADPKNDYPRPDILIEAADLAKLAPDKVRILDARPKEEYLASHIPGAVRVEVAEWSKDVSDRPAAEMWGGRLADVGVEPHKTVIVYAADLRDAARLWWILKYVGVKDARLLNGGWTAWEAAKHPTESKENKPTAVLAEWKPVRERLATKEDVLKYLQDKSAGILDARTLREFTGQLKVQGVARGGAIPGCVHLEWTELIDPQTKKFKPMSELKQLLADRKVDLDKPAVTYCQSGGRAAVLAFGLELMGGKQVINYYKSWSEWCNAKDTPVEAGKKRE